MLWQNSNYLYLLFVLQDKSYLYKTMLQELAIKEGISLTNYKTTSNGASHMPIFSSTVEALLSSCLYESWQASSKYIHAILMI